MRNVGGARGHSRLDLDADRRFDDRRQHGSDQHRGRHRVDHTEASPRRCARPSRTTPATDALPGGGLAVQTTANAQIIGSRSWPATHGRRRAGQLRCDAADRRRRQRRGRRRLRVHDFTGRSRARGPARERRRRDRRPRARRDEPGRRPRPERRQLPRGRGRSARADAPGRRRVRRRRLRVVPPVVEPTPTPTASPQPTVSPTPTATPTRPRRRSWTRSPGRASRRCRSRARSWSSFRAEKTFKKLDPSVIANGAEVDTRKGTVEITRSDGGKAIFYGGIFKLSQSGGITTLTLTEKLTGCPSGQRKLASSAAAKPKTRKLWGDGKGRFRTKGQYSAATVRGTKWLVQDGCRYTRTTVATGVVSVRDEVLKKTKIAAQGQVVHRETEAIDRPMRWNGILATTIIALLAAASPAAADTFVVNTDRRRHGLLRRELLDPAGDRPFRGDPGRGHDPDPAQATIELSQGAAAGRPARSRSPAPRRGPRRSTPRPARACSTIAGDDRVDLAPDRQRRRRQRQRSARRQHRRSRAPSRSITSGSRTGPAYSGGGIANRNGTMTIQNSLIDHNRADMGGGDGGGIINFGGDGGVRGPARRQRLDDRVQHRPADRRDHPVRRHARATRPPSRASRSRTTRPATAGRRQPQHRHRHRVDPQFAHRVQPGRLGPGAKLRRNGSRPVAAPTSSTT